MHATAAHVLAHLLFAADPYSPKLVEGKFSEVRLEGFSGGWMRHAPRSGTMPVVERFRTRLREAGRKGEPKWACRPRKARTSCAEGWRRCSPATATSTP